MVGHSVSQQVECRAIVLFAVPQDTNSTVTPPVVSANIKFAIVIQLTIHVHWVASLIPDYNMSTLYFIFILHVYKSEPTPQLQVVSLPAQSGPVGIDSMGDLTPPHLSTITST